MARTAVHGVSLGVLLAAFASSAATAPVKATYRIPSGSMEPTLHVGDRVTAEPGAPAVGAIVTFHPSQEAVLERCGPKPHQVHPGGRACAAPVPREDTSITFVSRVVAGPGDRIFIRAGHVYRRAGGHGRFVREPDSDTRACGRRPACNFPVPVTVPAGSWYLLGDNRGESLDSREVGAVPAGWITGVVTAITWPPPRRRTLPTA
jgi:signal peptidase I